MAITWKFAKFSGVIVIHIVAVGTKIFLIVVTPSSGGSNVYVVGWDMLSVGCHF